MLGIFAQRPEKAFSVNRRNFGRQRIYPLSHKDLGGFLENEGLLRQNQERQCFYVLTALR